MTVAKLIETLQKLGIEQQSFEVIWSDECPNELVLHNPNANLMDYLFEKRVKLDANS